MTYREFSLLKFGKPNDMFPDGTEAGEAIHIIETSLMGSRLGGSYSEVVKSIIEKYKKHHKCNFDEICNINAQEAVDILKEELLGKDWYVNYSCNYRQCNTEIVGEILNIYGPKEKVPFLTRIRNFFK